jgi:ABC-type lipoprotein release transport system permease subunit
MNANDPYIFIAVAMLLARVAFAACYFPAHYANKIDPLTAFRTE